MNEQRQIEELAKIEGYKRSEKMGLWGRGEGSYYILNRAPFSDLPDYLNSHDAIQRVIDGLDDEMLHEYTVGLIFLSGYSAFADVLLKATPRQKAEAVLKALGKWEEGQ